MKSKDRFDFYLKEGIRKQGDDLKIIENLVNRLIDSLYKPQAGEVEFCVDNERVACYAIAEEPINWGDLKVVEVIKEEEFYKVVIDEASPGGCPTLCEYIERYMSTWGWNVKVETEW